jgi:hypothetical protein
MELLKNLEGMSADEQMTAVVELQKAAMKQLEEQKQVSIGKSAEMVIQGLKKIKSDFEAKFDSLNYDIQAKVSNLKDGEQGIQGPKGEAGDRGLDGANGRDGRDGKDGQDGLDGVDGVGVRDAKIDFDGSLVISLTDGREINCGEVVSVDVAKQIQKVTHNIQTGSGGDSQTVLDAIAALQATIATYGTMATQNANAVAITGGTIDNTVIGGTTPAAGTFTTLTAQTEVLKGTGQNLLTYSQDFTNGAWSKARATISASLFTAPDGTTTANELVEDSTTNSHPVYRTLGGFINGITYTLSVYAKASGRTSLRLALADTAFVSIFADYNLTTVASSASGGTSTITSVGNGWYRLTLTAVAIASGNGAVYIQPDNPYQTSIYLGNGASAIYLWGAQGEIGSTANTYIPTTTTAVYGTPTLSFSGVSTIGLQSDGSLYVSPAGTGALQAQATTSSAVGGNARGANAVDLQTSRTAASQVASGTAAVISGGQNNVASVLNATVGGGLENRVSGGYGAISGGYNNSVSNGGFNFIGGGNSNTNNGTTAVLVGGSSNTSSGLYNFIGGGFTNSATASAAVTTQSATMNGTTAVTLSGSNASIKVGQYITGTSIAGDTYVAAISGTSLTLSKVASGSSTSTLSFFTPHGVVVGGGNNQATGAYSVILGGGDAGTAANRNVASGVWSVVVGGRSNQATGIASFIGGGGTLAAGAAGNLASGDLSFIGGGRQNNASGTESCIISGVANIASGNVSTVLGGRLATTRGITGNVVGSASESPIGGSAGNSQFGILVLGKETTNATATVITSDGGSGSTTNQVILPNNSAYYFKGSVIANVTGAANGAAWEFSGAIMRGANAASTVLIGTPAINRVAATAGATAWVIALTADTTNGGLAVTVTGAASTTIRWVASVNTVEVTY